MSVSKVVQEGDPESYDFRGACCLCSRFSDIAEVLGPMHEFRRVGWESERGSQVDERIVMESLDV